MKSIFAMQSKGILVTESIDRKTSKSMLINLKVTLYLKKPHWNFLFKNKKNSNSSKFVTFNWYILLLNRISFKMEEYSLTDTRYI